MNVLMISIDRGLLGKGQLGDVVERHRRYGEFVDRFDIIVFSPLGYEKFSLSDNTVAYPTNSRNKIMRIFDAWRLGRKLCAGTKYDLIIAMDPFFTGLVATRLKKKTGANFLVHFHGDFWGNQLSPVLKLLSQYVVKNADAIRVMSEGQKEELVKVGVAPEKIAVISTPVNLRVFHANYDYVPQHDFKIVLHVGRPDPVKDYKTLLRAFELIHEKFNKVKFIQCGADLKRSNLIGVNANKDLNLESYDKVTQDFLFESYVMSDVVILSSISESFGKVLVEANACGKPVVSTATAGAKEIIQDGVNGFLVPIGDAQALADKIVYLLEHPDQAKAMGERGRELVKEKFGNNTEKIIQLWHEVSGK